VTYLTVVLSVQYMHTSVAQLLSFESNTYM